jgi:hypothetical protein
MEKREQDRQARKKLLIEQKLLKEKTLKESIEKAKLEKELFEKEQFEKEKLALELKTREILLKRQKLKEELETKNNIADTFHHRGILKRCYLKSLKRCQNLQSNFKKAVRIHFTFIFKRIQRTYNQRKHKLDSGILLFQSSQLARSYLNIFKSEIIRRNINYQASVNMDIKRTIKSIFVALKSQNSLNHLAKLHHQKITNRLIFHQLFKLYKIRTKQREIKDKINNKKADSYFIKYAPKLVWRNWIKYVQDQKDNRFREHKRQRLRVLAKVDYIDIGTFGEFKFINF